MVRWGVTWFGFRAVRCRRLTESLGVERVATVVDSCCYGTSAPFRLANRVPTCALASVRSWQSVCASRVRTERMCY